MCQEATSFRVTKTFNNNVLAAVSSCGERVVLTGRGIGFQRRPGNVIGPQGVDLVYVLEDDLAATRAERSLSSLDPEVIDIARQVLATATQRLVLRNPASLLLPLADHIAFIVERGAQGTHMDFPLQWEVREMYPVETQVGAQAVALVRERLQVHPEPGEETAFALHFVAGQMARGGLGGAMRTTSLIARVLQAVTHSTGVRVDPASLAGRRFIVHLRFLLSRLSCEPRSDGAREPDAVTTAIHAQTGPTARGAASAVAAVLEQELSQRLSPVEMAFLTLHLHLLTTRSTSSGKDKQRPRA